MRRLVAQLGNRFGALGELFRSPRLRRLQLAWGGFYLGEWAHFVALSVYAYEKGGVAAVGVLGLVRMVPAAAAVPLGAVLADRYARELVLVGVHLSRAAAVGGAAAVLAAGGPTALVFALAALAATFSAPFRPAQLALLPFFARTPQELVAANVSGSTLEGLAVLSGPALAGVLLAVSSPAVVLAVSAAVFLGSALLVLRIGRSERRPAAGSAKRALAEALAGFRTLARQPQPRLIIGLFAAQTFVRGLLNVLLVVTALRVLDIGDSGVGFLNSAFGAGGLAGALAAVSLVGRRRLANPFSLGLVFWGAPIALVGAWPAGAWALVCLALVGAGNAVLDVSGYTLIQRSVDDSVLGRVFGVFEILVMASIGLGSILAPVLVAELGPRGALAVTGALLPALALVFRSGLKAIDAAAEVPERELALLSSVPLFTPLPITTLERLASRLRPVRVPAGTEVVRQGDPGDLFYVIAAGEADVIHDGARVATLGLGQYFGEIALLRDVPRVATVVARTDLDVYALERDVFVSAVSGHAQSAAAAEDVMGARLAGLRVPTAPL